MFKIWILEFSFFSLSECNIKFSNPFGKPFTDATRKASIEIMIIRFLLKMSSRSEERISFHENKENMIEEYGLVPHVQASWCWLFFTTALHKSALRVSKSSFEVGNVCLAWVHRGRSLPRAVRAALSSTQYTSSRDITSICINLTKYIFNAQNIVPSKIYLRNLFKEVSFILSNLNNNCLRIIFPKKKANERKNYYWT